MNQRLRPSDIAPLTAAIRRPVEQLVQPCPCPKESCRTVGEHIFRATRDAQRGIPAAALEPSRAGATGLQLPPPPEPVDRAHDDLCRVLAAIVAHAYLLTDLIAEYRPDRLADATDPELWCRHHLDHIGVCEPRYRADLCRRCYDFELGTRTTKTAKGILPPDDILQAWHRGERVTSRMVDDAVKAARAAARKRRRRKART